MKKLTFGTILVIFLVSLFSSCEKDEDNSLKILDKIKIPYSFYKTDTIINTKEGLMAALDKIRLKEDNRVKPLYDTNFSKESIVLVSHWNTFDVDSCNYNPIEGLSLTFHRTTPATDAPGACLFMRISPKIPSSTKLHVTFTGMPWK